MPRITVPLVEGERYHVYNRGADKRDIFLSKKDYLRFYRSLELFNSIEPVTNFEFAQVHRKKNSISPKLVKIIAYCLLPNHFHLILEQVAPNGISEFLKRVSGGYTSYFNLQQERSGVLLQGRFKRVLIDSDEQFNYLLVYVNENHFVHGINFEREICHSSSLHYQGVYKSKILEVNTTSYNFTDSVDLALSIYERRAKQKKSDLLEN